MSEFVDALRAIQAASNSDEVVDALRVYLSCLPLEDVAELPWGLSAQLMRTPSDIAMWALHMRGKGSMMTAGAAYGRVAKLLAESTIRLAELGAVLH